jgi:predicted acylesterase/phospholipase RssA
MTFSAIIAVPTSDMSRCQVFRTYPSRQSGINCTLTEALCSSLATPPLFDPVSIGQRLVQQKFVGGSVGYCNPTRELLREAKSAYGDDQILALVLSLGSGLPPVLSLEPSTSPSGSIELLAKHMAIDCERVARELSNQLMEVDAYLRLNVNRGLEGAKFDDWSCVGPIETHTRTYLETTSVTQAVSKSATKATKRVGSITLGQLSSSYFII